MLSRPLQDVAKPAVLSLAEVSCTMPIAIDFSRLSWGSEFNEAEFRRSGVSLPTFLSLGLSRLFNST